MLLKVSIDKPNPDHVIPSGIELIGLSLSPISSQLWKTNGLFNFNRLISIVPCWSLWLSFEVDSYHKVIHDYQQIYLSNTLRWRHNGHDCFSNLQPHHCLLNRLFGCRSKKTSKLRVTGLCAGNSPGTGEFPTQMASNAENVSIWWRHHD